MSIRSIVNFGDALNLAVGVNAIIMPDGSCRFFYCILKKTGNMITVVEKSKDIPDAESLTESLQSLLDKGVRVHVNCVGRSVLTRINTGKNQEQSVEDMQKSFPGIRKEDFVFQYFRKENFQMISLVRNTDIAKSRLLLENRINSFSMGICILEAIASAMQTRSLTLEGYRVEFDGGEIKTVEATDATSPFDQNENDPVPPEYLLAYASAFSLFLPPADLETQGLPEWVEEAPSRYEARERIFKTSRVLVVVLLAFLSVNAAVFFWLSGQVSEMEASLSFTQGKNKNDMLIQKRIQKLADSFESIGWEANKIPLFYADQIASTVPVEVQLNSLEEGILDQSMFRKEKKYQFDNKQIRIQGMSVNPAALSSWIASLKKMKWIEEINGQNYNFDQRLGKGIFEFSIRVRE
jgi:hypothetical protein